MSNSKLKNLTEGNIPSQIISFVIPLMISSIVQSLFNSADIAVLGQMADLTAVAAISSIGSVISIIVASLNGLSHGAVILVAQAIGRKDRDTIRRLSSTALLTAIGIGLLIVLCGVTCNSFLPAMVGCPEECYSDASLYILIYFSAAPFILVYNFTCAVIRATGNSKTPTVIIIAAGLINIVLNVILCFFLTRKVAAVAIATFASQLFSAVASLIVLWKMGDPYRPCFSLRSFHGQTFIRILKIGLPCAFSTAIFQIGNLPLVRSINSFGAPTIAGNSACIQLEGFISSLNAGFASAALTFIGQNFGAGKNDRVRASFFHVIWMTTAVSVFASGICFLFHEPLLSLFLSGEGLEEALQVGFTRMLYIVSFYFVAGWKNTIASSIEALGHTVFTTANNILSVLVLRYIWVYLIFPHYHTIGNLYLCCLASWFLSLFIDIIVYVYYAAKHNIYKKEKNISGKTEAKAE